LTVQRVGGLTAKQQNLKKVKDHREEQEGRISKIPRVSSRV